MEGDPYLAYQPAFAYTLPVQLLVNGVTLTLLVVLLIHLLCASRALHMAPTSTVELTARSHDAVPLSPRSSQLLLAALLDPRRPHLGHHQSGHHPADILRQG
jgi:hypothetical protein